MPDRSKPDIVAQWAAIVDRFKRPAVGSSVRVRGRDVVGIVMQDFPIVVRDGRGHEHEIALFEVRL